nr:MFS transporter [Streptomyces gossypiisoli]
MRVLFLSQILSGAGLAAGITVGGLLAEQMLGSTRLAGLPSALFTAGSALAAVLVGRISQARGRRPGLALGYLTGAVGALGVIAATVLDSPVLLFVSLFVYGSGTATNLQARYCGADLAAPAHRARAVSTVLVATTLGGVLGPNLAAPTGNLASALGIPDLAGPFLLAGAAYTLAALVLALWLHPDPLLLARELHATRPAAPNPTSGQEIGKRKPGVVLGALVMILTQLVMTAIMTMHDYRRGEQSVVAVSGAVTGRKVGGALSEIGLAALAQGDAAANDINYVTRTGDGRIIKSSTMPLRDGSGHVFGALCVNVDVTALRQAGDLLTALAGTPPVQVTATTFSNDFDDVVDALVRAEEVSRGKPVSSLTRVERLALLQVLDRRGVFSVRNAVPRVAERLGVSRSAVYADLNECRKTPPADPPHRSDGEAPGGTAAPNAADRGESRRRAAAGPDQQ